MKPQGIIQREIHKESNFHGKLLPRKIDSPVRFLSSSFEPIKFSECLLKFNTFQL